MHHFQQDSHQIPVFSGGGTHHNWLVTPALFYLPPNENAFAALRKERYLYLREEMAVSDEVSRMRTAIKEGIKRGIKLTKKVFQLSQKGCTIAQIAEKCNIEESEVKEILE